MVPFTTFLSLLVPLNHQIRVRTGRTVEFHEEVHIQIYTYIVYSSECVGTSRTHQYFKPLFSILASALGLVERSARAVFISPSFCTGASVSVRSEPVEGWAVDAWHLA